MSIIIEDSDSEIEILNSRTLRTSYFHQQLKLINDIKEVNRLIPKKWENFKEFIYFNISWQPPVNLIRSVWKKLCLAEEEISGRPLPLEVIELSDEEPSDDCSIVSVIPNDERMNSVLKERSADSDLKQKPTALIEPIISYMPDRKAQSPSKQMRKRKRSTKSSCDSKEQCEIDFSIDAKNSNKETKDVSDDLVTENVKKKVSKKRRKSSLGETEAELMRQILLIDKLIELNLPKVLESVIPDFSPSSLVASGLLPTPDFSQTPKMKRAPKNKKIIKINSLE